MSKEKIKIKRAVKLSVDKIRKNDYNPNETTPKVDKAIAESMNFFGQVQELVVRPDPKEEGSYIIIDGEHRWALTQESEIFANIIYGLSEAEAKKLTLILGETQGISSKVKLAKLLSDIRPDFKDNDFSIGLPYEAKELGELVSMGGLDWENYESGNGYQVAGLSTEENLSLTNTSKFNANDIQSDDYKKQTNKVTTTKTTITETGSVKSNGSVEDILEPIFVKVSKKQKDLIYQAKDLISQEYQLSEHMAIANGEVFYHLANKYLNG